MTETHRIPRIAVLAMQQAESAFKAHAEEIGRQTVISLGFNPDDQWSVDFTTGTISREVPSPQAEP